MTPLAAGQPGGNRSSQTEQADSVQIEPAHDSSPTVRERARLRSDAYGHYRRCAAPLDIRFSSGHPYDSAVLGCDPFRRRPETELGTDKGKPARKAGTQSHRSKGVTA